MNTPKLRTVLSALKLGPVVLALALLPSVAFARKNGIATDSCSGCHKGGTAPKVMIISDLPRAEPGGSITLTVKVQAVNGPMGGFYLTSNSRGSFTVIAGQGVSKVSENEVVHSVSKTAVGTEVSWQVKWTAPAVKGGVTFDAFAVSAQGGSRGGRSAQGDARFAIGVGCDGVDGFIDQDSDGFGLSDDRGPMKACEYGIGFAKQGGDCNDGNKDVYPGAKEICDSYDNNCDGKTNEGLPSVLTYRDSDNDKHGAIGTKDTRMWCGDGQGYAVLMDDCDDNDPMIFPGAMEICGNSKDDDCNGKVDENKPSCGQGWCRRTAASCDVKTCIAGPPRMESCNGFDDDCDGVVDNGMGLCEAGKICAVGLCVTSMQAAGLNDAAALLAAKDASVPDVQVPSGSGGARMSLGSGGSAAPMMTPVAGSMDAAAPVEETKLAQGSSGCAIATAPARGTGLGLLGLVACSLFIKRRRRR